MKKYSTNDHAILATWALDCAEGVLPLFERNYAEDARPGVADRLDLVEDRVTEELAWQSTCLLDHLRGEIMSRVIVEPTQEGFVRVDPESAAGLLSQ